MELYRITNKTNGKFYIGITRHSAASRYRLHCKCAYRLDVKTTPLWAAIKKYGPENFALETLAVGGSWDYMQELERRAIAAYGSNSRRVGYNRTAGGDGFFGGKHDASARAKLSAAHKGRKHTAETRAIFRAIALNRTYSEETRRKMSESAKSRPAEDRAKHSVFMTGRKHSEETKAKMSAAKLGMKYRPRKSPMSAEERQKRSRILLAFHAAKRAARGVST